MYYTRLKCMMLMRFYCGFPVSGLSKMCCGVFEVPLAGRAATTNSTRAALVAIAE